MFPLGTETVLDGLSDLVLSPQRHVDVNPVLKGFVFVVHFVENLFNIDHSILNVFFEIFENVLFLFGLLHLNHGVLNLVKTLVNLFDNILAIHNLCFASIDLLRQLTHHVLNSLNLFV